MGKDAIKHSDTLVQTVGNGSNVSQYVICRTGVGNRTLDGSVQTIQDSSNTGQFLQVSDIVKYFNIILQAAITEAGSDQNTQTQGWIEWAITWRDESTVNIPSTNLGVKTLGDICTQMFRGDCLMTGQFPVSVNLPNVERILLKVPQKAIKWKIGNELVLNTIFRSAEVTDLSTDTVRLVKSTHFKVYS